MFERFVPDKGPDVRDGVGRVGNEFVGNGPDGLVPFVAVAKGSGSQHGDDEGKGNGADDPATRVLVSFHREVCSLSEHKEIDKIDSWAERLMGRCFRQAILNQCASLVTSNDVNKQRLR